MVIYLMISTIVCSVTHMSLILQTAKANAVLLKQSEYEKCHYYRCLARPRNSDLTMVDFGNMIVKILEKNRYKIDGRVSQNGSHYVAASKGQTGLFGPFLVHVGLVVIFIGAGWTAMKSYSYFLNIAVGESLPLPDTLYSVQLHDFTVQYYEGTDRPSEYTSVLSLTKNGDSLGTGKITVNNPLTIADMSFYQMSYNPTVSDVTISVSEQHSGKKLGEFKLPVGQDAYIEKLGLNIKPVDLLPDFALTTDGVAVSRTAVFKNPAVLLDISTTDTPKVSKWIFYAPSEFHFAVVGSYAYELKDFTIRTISGIKVIRDRAIPVVYTGFFLLTTGAFLSCYIFHRRVWVRIELHQEHPQITIAGKCNRNILDFQREMNRCAAHISLLDNEVLL